jgi:hypothetical protein
MKLTCPQYSGQLALQWPAHGTPCGSECLSDLPGPAYKTVLLTLLLLHLSSSCCCPPLAAVLQMGVVELVV